MDMKYFAAVREESIGRCEGNRHSLLKTRNVEFATGAPVFYRTQLRLLHASPHDRARA